MRYDATPLRVSRHKIPWVKKPVFINPQYNGGSVRDAIAYLGDHKKNEDFTLLVFPFKYYNESLNLLEHLHYQLKPLHLAIDWWYRRIVNHNVECNTLVGIRPFGMFELVNGEIVD
jgi:hypothetical protein